MSLKLIPIHISVLVHVCKHTSIETIISGVNGCDLVRHFRVNVLTPKNSQLRAAEVTCPCQWLCGRTPMPPLGIGNNDLFIVPITQSTVRPAPFDQTFKSPSWLDSENICDLLIGGIHKIFVCIYIDNKALTILGDGRSSPRVCFCKEYNHNYLTVSGLGSHNYCPMRVISLCLVTWNHPPHTCRPTCISCSICVHNNCMLYV